MKESTRPPLYDSIGALIDAWEVLPNDLKSELETVSPPLVNAIKGIIDAIEFYKTMPEIEAETTERDIVDQVEALLANEPPWTVETHDARGDYVRIALVRRGPQFVSGYYVIADDDMESRREQAIKDFKDIVRGRELLRRLVEEVKHLREQVASKPRPKAGDCIGRFAFRSDECTKCGLSRKDHE